MRRILSILISLIFCAALFVPMQFSAAITLGQSLLSNGGFESTSGYTAYGGWGGSYASLQTTEVYSGSSALKLNGGGGNPWVNTLVNNLAGGCTVTLSFRYKADLPERTGDNENAFFGIKFEGYVDAVRTDYAAGAAEPAVTEVSVGEWTQANVEYTLDERANLLVVYFRMYNMTSGTVYVDDAELYISKLPTLSFKATTDQVFYYSDMQQEEGCAVVSLNNYFDDSGYTADFKFMDSKTQVHGAENVEFIDNKAQFTYPLSLLKVKKKEYKILITVKDPDGVAISEITKYVYKYDRPKSLSKEGVYTDRNGKEIKPVMNYHMAEFSDTEAWEAMVASGINVIQYVVPNDINQAFAELDALYEMGCYAAVVCYFDMLPAGNAANNERVFNQMSLIADHPAVFSWMAMDEPYLHNIHADDDLRKSYILLRNLNDYAPVYICECTSAYMGEAVKYCDIIAPDPYPANRNSYGTFVSVLVDKAEREAAKQSKLTMGILQCCTVEGGTPTALQVHSMILQNYLSGAKAHGWYAWEPDYTDIDKSLHKSPYWDALMKFHRFEEQLVYDYYVKGKYKTFNVDKPGDIEAQTGDVWYESWTDGKEIYGIIQNRRGTAVTASVPLTSENEMVVIEDYDFSFIYDGAGNPVFTKERGRISVELEPYHAVMFKITPEEEINTDRLSAENYAQNGNFESMTDGVLSSWNFVDTTHTAALVTDSSAHTGENYISLSSAGTYIESTFEGEQGKTYMLEAMYKSDTANAATVQMYDSAGRASSCMEVRPETAEEWAPVRAMITVGESMSPTVRIQLGNAIADATVCFDSVTVTEAEHTPGNMILNGDFEADSAKDIEHQNITNWQSGNAIKLTEYEPGNNAIAIRQQNRATGAILINDKAFSTKQEDTEFEFSFKVNDVSYDAAKAPWIRLLTYRMNSDASLTAVGNPVSVPMEITEANTWTQAGGIVTIPAGVNYIKIDISSGAGWTLFDDFCFTRYKRCFEIRNADGEAVNELPVDTEYIEAEVIDEEKTGRLYVAQYRVTDSGERLVKIACATGGVGGSPMKCRIPANDFVKGQTVVKVFLWTGQMQADNITVLR